MSNADLPPHLRETERPRLQELLPEPVPPPTPAAVEVEDTDERPVDPFLRRN